MQRTISAITFIIAAGLLSSCNSSSSKPMDAAPAINTTQARSEYVEAAPNVRLHVTDLGDGQPVILIHGYPLSDASWEYQYHDLLKAGYRVIGITLRGFGQSDKPYSHYNYDEFADDIKGVLDKLDIKEGILGGHSMGGAIALHYVAKHNSAHINKLILFNAAAPCHTKKPDYPYPLFTKDDINNFIKYNSTDRPAFLSALATKFTLSPTSLNAGIGAWLGSIEMQSSPYAMEQALIALRDEDLRSDLPKIQIPTLILHATKDSIVSFALAEQMKAGIKNATLVPFEKSGHASFLEEREKTKDEVLKFIKQ